MIKIIFFLFSYSTKYNTIYSLSAWNSKNKCEISMVKGFRLFFTIKLSIKIIRLTGLIEKYLIFNYTFE